MSRDKILEAAAYIFSKVGYHRANMQEIAEEAGVAKGTLYYHFTSKARLFSAVVTEGMQMIINKVKSSLDNDMSGEKQIQEVININIQLYADYPELGNIFFNELSSGIEKEVLDEINKLKEIYINFIADRLEEGYKYGFVKKLNFKLAAIGIIGTLGSICKEYIENKNTIELDQVKKLLHKLILSGILVE